MTAVAGADQLRVVDDPGGTPASKKITAGLLFGRALIEEIDNSAGSSDFDFAGIPGDYARLVLQGYVRGDRSTTVDVLRMTFNASTADSAYHHTTLYADNGADTTAEASSSRAAVVSGASASSGYHGVFRTVIEGYATPNKKTAHTVYFCPISAGSRARIGVYHTAWDLSAAITRVRLYGENDDLAGVVRLYGEY